MDISINRLNNRMALQVPAELPLGLVFIVGHVARLRRVQATDGGEAVYFDLVEGRHRLPCRLPGRVAHETLLREDDRVRAGGRLLFNPRRAGYLLVARHLEVLPRRSPDTSLQPILDDARERARQTSMADADLPPWVARLAPPEVRRELGLPAPVDGAADRAGAPTDDSGVDEPLPETTPRPTLSSEMVSFLSQAIDSDGDIELTAEMIDGYLPGSPAPDMGRMPAAEDGDKPSLPAEREQEAAPAPEELPFDLAQTEAQRPAARQLPLPLLAGLLLVLLLLVVVLLILTQM